MPTPPHSDATLRRATERLKAGDLQGAEALCRKAVEARPADPRAWGLLARTLVAQGRSEEGAACLGRQVALAPGDAAAHANLGRVLRDLERARADEAAFDRALALAPGLRPAVVGKAQARSDRGDHEGAFRLLEPLVAPGARGAPRAPDANDPRAACTFAQAARNLKRPEAGVMPLERVLARRDLHPKQRRLAAFELGHVLDALGRYDDAFAQFERANALATPPPGPDTYLEVMERVAAYFTPERLAGLARATAASDLPIYIVGMPRSGTSLVEQILASHPRVHGAGELMLIPNLATRLDLEVPEGHGYPARLGALEPAQVDALGRELLDRLGAMAPGAARVTDKMPHNFIHLGLIAMLAPGARVIHCTRDPVDTCLSCYFQDFDPRQHPYAGDLARLGRHYVAYRALMARWEGLAPLPIRTVRYEALVADTEAVSRELVAFCGLDWDPACLEFHRSRRPVRTASRFQVQQPVYRTSVARWRRYARHLAPLLETLGPLAPQVSAGP
jgi:tetratricopeptide (TPR) repeat protein